MQDSIKVRKALLSVSDKSGIEDLARFLADIGIEIVSTGGTANAISSAGIKVTEISDTSGFPEILDGRVKTLHPAVFGPILFSRANEEHLAELRRLGMEAIDLVVVNLYPFESVAPTGDFDKCIDFIDIGGHSLIRAAAKNHQYVAVAASPADYELLKAEISENSGATSLRFRRGQAAKAYAATSQYDSAIFEWMSKSETDEFPEIRVFQSRLKEKLRYGENPHQAAAVYLRHDRPGAVASARQHQGKPPGYNNLADADAAFKLVSEFEPEESAACAIIKHCIPCGAAIADSCQGAFRNALNCDRLSAFGGVVAFNRSLDGETAALILDIFTEIVIAPEIERSALEAFRARPDTRILSTGGKFCPAATEFEIKQISGGYLAQDADASSVNGFSLKVVTDRAPSPRQKDDLIFAWKIAKHAKSNAVILASDGATRGIGAGQTSRVDAAKMAAWKLKSRLGEDARRKVERDKSLVAASDAFFPFSDGIEVVAEAGAEAVIQPGGSVRDGEIIDEANKRGLAMVFSGIRNFRH
ncbi:MAG: bifunctional phosphoribosylaminoimidazolecarboxamide formyltransferase/IMP cyclohydrolase [Albidovulum sp.]|nr:bifunctional phosphoribosylaminoimidazolecarboxamide formyltransferase/IMP cyclohydrolase [Albidovulum sp.]